jgi:hypothetical protein
MRYTCAEAFLTDEELHTPLGYTVLCTYNAEEAS